MACVEQFGLVVFGSGLDGAVEFGIDILRHGLVSLIEVFGPVVFVEVEVSERLACVDKFLADLGDSFHIDFHLDAELLAEDPYQLDGGSGCAAAKPPDVCVDDVDALDDGCEH